MKANQVDEDRAGWLAWRAQGIGATDVAAIVGLSPWASAYSVWAEKTGRVPLDADDDSDVAEFGRRAEPMLAQWFRDRTGFYLREIQHRATFTPWPVARCTADALAYRSRRSVMPTGPVELKTTDRGVSWKDGLPDHIDAQVQWQMLVLEVDRGWVAALHGRRFVPYPVLASRTDQAFLLREARRFWHDNVLADVAPPAVPHRATSWALSKLARTDATVELDGARDVLARYARSRAVLSAAKREADAAATELRALLGDAEGGTVAGLPVVSYPLIKRRGYTVDPTEYRQLTVHWSDEP